jgi:hypothetical protein
MACFNIDNSETSSDAACQLRSIVLEDCLHGFICLIDWLRE